VRKRSSERLLDGLSNLGGPLRPANRALLRTALLKPSLEAWEATYSMLLTPRYSFWQVIKSLDPRCPKMVTFDPDLTVRWGGYFPDSFTVRRAFLWAAEQDMNASSHA
jgi:hypothetical protein